MARVQLAGTVKRGWYLYSDYKHFTRASYADKPVGKRLQTDHPGQGSLLQSLVQFPVT